MKLFRLHDTPDEAWLVTGDPLPPPSGTRWRSPEQLQLWLQYGALFKDMRELDPTVTP